MDVCCRRTREAMARVPKWLLGAGVVVLLFEVVIALWLRQSTGVLHYQLLRLQQLFLLEVALSVGSFYIYKRFAAAVLSLNDGELRNLRRRWTQICATDVVRAFVAFCLILAQASFMFYAIRFHSEVSTAAFLCLLCLAGYIHMLMLLVISDILVCASYFVRKMLGKTEHASVSEFMQRYRLTQMTVISVLTALFLVYGLYRTSTPPTIVNENIRTAKLSEDSSFSIVLLSDLHIGPSVGRARIQTIVDTVNSLNPDFIAISGDLADGFVAELGNAAEPLCGLRSKYGVYFATGNHEYYHGNVDEWFAFLRECNVTVLHNANRRVVTAKGDSFCIAGIDDLITLKLHLPGHGMNPQKALEGCKENDFVALLAHQPNAAHKVLNDRRVNGNVDLILSGHTHNGQFFFFVPFIHIANAFAHGLYFYGPSQTFVLVSAGVNFFGPPVRTAGFCEVVRLLVSGR